MYYSFVISAAFLIYCFASPAQYGPPNTGSLDRYHGSNATGSTNLSSPILIPPYTDWRVTYTEDFTNTPNGFELAATIVSNIYIYWKGDVNRPIKSKTTFRRIPYTDFLHTFEPSSLRGAYLTPQLLGRGYLGCLLHIIGLRDWPGLVTAQMLAREKPGMPLLDIGYIRIDYSPIRTASTPPETHIDSAAISSTARSSANTQTRRWLACFVRLFYFVVAHSWSDKVTDDPDMPPKPWVARYRYPCLSRGDDELEMMVLPAANSVLTWNDLHRAMISWLISVARNPGSYLDSRPITSHGGILATLQVKFDRVGVDEWDGAVANA